MEQKRSLRSKQSVIGRINTRQLALEEEDKKRIAEEQAALQAMVDQLTGAPLLPFLPHIKNNHTSSTAERRDKAVTPIMKKRAAAAAIAEAEERLREEGGSPGAAQLTHKAKRIARKQAKEARKAEAKRRILGGGADSDVIGGGEGEKGGEQSGAGAEGVVVEAYAVSEDEAGAMESGEGAGGGGGAVGMHIMHATIAVPDISESHPLPMPPIQPAELTDQVHHPYHPPSHSQRELQTIAEHSSEAAPSPPPPAAGEGRGGSGRGSKKEERGEGSVKLPPI